MGEALRPREKDGEEDKANAEGEDGLIITSLSGKASPGERSTEGMVGLRREGNAREATLRLLLVAALLRGEDVGRAGNGDLERGPRGEERGDDNKDNASRMPPAEGARVRLGTDLSRRGLGATPGLTRDGGGPSCCVWLSKAGGQGAASPNPSEPSASGRFMNACARNKCERKKKRCLEFCGCVLGCQVK